MGIRREIELIELLLTHLHNHREGLEGFEKFYLILSQVTSALQLLDKNFRIELKSYKNGLEVSHLHIDSSGVYQYFETLPPLEQKKVDRELESLNSLLIKVKNETHLAYCPCCGYDLSDRLYEENDISAKKCPCCGISLATMSTLTIDDLRNYRNIWMKQPSRWYESNYFPDDWKFEDQVVKIPDDYW
jgi:hypothetical protein